jgi:hypothetical protein
MTRRQGSGRPALAASPELRSRADGEIADRQANPTSDSRPLCVAVGAADFQPDHELPDSAAAHAITATDAIHAATKGNPGLPPLPAID